MNLNSLEGLIKSIVDSFVCEGCQKKVNIKDVSIKFLELNSVILEIDCPTCSRKSLIKSQVMSIDITKYLTKEQLSSIKKSIDDGSIKKDNITDEQIVNLNRDFKKEDFNVSDLFD